MVSEDRRILATALLLVIGTLIIGFLVVGCSDIMPPTEPEFAAGRGGGAALTIDSLAILPYWDSTKAVKAGEPSQQCAYAVFGDGRVADFTNNPSPCHLMYYLFPETMRAVSRKQQSIADAL